MCVGAQWKRYASVCRKFYRRLCKRKSKGNCLEQNTAGGCFLSAFLSLYQSIPDKHKSNLTARKTFYGITPVTAEEMYEHTKNVNDYYWREIGVSADNDGTILDCRQNAFALLESQPGYLNNPVFNGSYNEQWSLRKVMRRFIWHDRIHAKAMYRMAVQTFGKNAGMNIYQF